MNFFGGPQRFCVRCGEEPVSILGGICSPCAVKQDRDDRDLREREVAALERIADAAENVTITVQIDDAVLGRVLAYERHNWEQASRSRSRAKSKPKVG